MDMKKRRKTGTRRPGKLLLLAALILGMAVLPGCGSRMNKKELRELGIEAMRAGDYEGAKQRFAEALEASDGEVSELQYDILKYRGECEIRLGQYEEAQETYGILAQLDTKEENQRKYQEVLQELSGLSGLKEAIAHMDAGEYETAVEMLEPLAELHGGMVGMAAWFNRAVCMEHLQQFDEAEEAFSAYVEQYPEDEKALRELDFLKTR